MHMWEMIYSYVRRDSFICATWHIHMCDSLWGMAHSYLWWRLMHICDVRGTWLIYMWDMTHHGTWLMHMWHMTSSYESHDSCICETWLMHVRHDSFICVRFLFQMCDMTSSHEWHAFYTGLFCRNIGLFCGDTGLFCVYKWLFGGYRGLVCRYVGLFCENRRLFCRNILLYCGNTGLFCKYQEHDDRRSYERVMSEGSVGQLLYRDLLRTYTALLRKYKALSRIPRTRR